VVRTLCPLALSSTDVGAELRPFYTPESWERLSTVVERAKHNGEPYELEVEMILADGRRVWRAVRGEALRDSNGRIVKLRGTSQDITDRKRFEEQLKYSTARLRALSARLESAREEEGMRIAREIHDELGSALTGLKRDIESFNKILASNANGDQLQSAKQKIPTMTKLIDETINTVRRIASELRPDLAKLSFARIDYW
jgi:signal transduction histidine kinase